MFIIFIGFFSFNYLNSFLSLHGNDLLENLLNRRTYTERDAAIIIRNLVDTLKHLHSRNIAHLDIKVKFEIYLFFHLRTFFLILLAG